MISAVLVVATAGVYGNGGTVSQLVSPCLKSLRKNRLNGRAFPSWS
jgi:hypothetical protein